MNKEQLTKLHQSVQDELHLILSSLKKEMKADVASIYVYDSENCCFYLPVGVGLYDPNSFYDPMMLPRGDRGAAKLTLGDSPLFIERIEEHPEFYGAFANRERIQSFAGMPCLIDVRIVGVLFVSFRSQHSFNDQEKKILEDFSLRAGNAIVDSSILHNLPQTTVEPAYSLQKNLQGIVELACATTNSSLGIWLLDPTKKDRFCLRASTGFPTSYREKAYHTLGDGSIICQVFSSGKEQFIEDLQSDEHFSFKKVAKDAGWRSVFCYPITSRGKLIGVIESFTFTPWFQDQGLISTYHQLADLVGMTLENLRRTEEAGQIAALIRKMSIEPDYKSILLSIVNTARELTEADSCSIFLYDRRSREFTSAVTSPEDIKIELPRNNGLTKKILDAGKIIHIRDSVNDRHTDKLRNTKRAKSLIGVRLDVGQEGVGVLYVRGNRIKQFVEADETLLTTLTNQVSLGFSGLFLLRSIRDIEDAAAKRFDKEKVLESICDEVIDLGFDIAAIQLISQEERIIETVLIKGTPSGSDWSGVAKHSLDSDKKIRDIQADIALEDPPLVKIVTGWCEKFDRWIYDEFNHSAYTRVWVPIILVRDEKGSLVDHWFDAWDGKVDCDGVVVDSEEDRSGYITRIIMAQPAINPGHRAEIIGTIEAGYYDPKAVGQDLRKRKRIKSDQGIDLAKMAARWALELRKIMLPYVLEIIADRAWEIIQADSASLHFLYDQERKKYSYEVCMGDLSQKILEGHQLRPEGLGQRAIDDDKVKFVPDVSQNDANDKLKTLNPNAWKVGVRTMAAVPLVMDKETGETGVLYVLFRKLHLFTDDKIGWKQLQLFANRAVEVIRNTHSYDQIRDNERALTALHSISKSLTARPQDKNLLRQIAGNAMNVLAADTTTIFEYEEAEKRFLMPPDNAGRLLYEPKKERIQVLGRHTPPRLLLKHLDDSDDFYPVDDCLNDPIMNSPDRDKTKKEFFIVREKIKSSAGFVLRVAKESPDGGRKEGGKEIVGVMFVNFRRSHVFTEQEKNIIKTLASNAAIAIKNRRLLTVLTAGTHGILTTLNLKDLLSLIVQRAVNITGGDVGNIRLVAGLTSDELVAYAQYPEEEAVNENLRRIKIGQGFIGMVAKEKEARIVYDTKDEPDRKPYFSDLDSCVYVPMLTGDGELLGILASGSRNISNFDEQDRMMLEALADQAVIALQNAKQQEQLTKTETMAALGDIAGNFSHQVNNKVGAIRALSKTIKDQVEGQIQDDVEQILESAEKIIDWVKKLYKSNSIIVESVDIRRVLDTARREVKYHDNIEIDFSCLTSDIPPAKADEQQILFLFINLFQNAIDAMPDGGKLQVTSRVVAYSDRTLIQISITDTGTGIPNDQLVKIFQRGFTTKDDGLGFGLWWNKNYIERLGGKLMVNSIINEGSCFNIHLPEWKNEHFS